MVDVITDQLKT